MSDSIPPESEEGLSTKLFRKYSEAPNPPSSQGRLEGIEDRIDNAIEAYRVSSEPRSSSNVDAALQELEAARLALTDAYASEVSREAANLVEDNARTDKQTLALYLKAVELEALIRRSHNSVPAQYDAERLKELDRLVREILLLLVSLPGVRQHFDQLAEGIQKGLPPDSKLLEQPPTPVIATVRAPRPSPSPTKSTWLNSETGAAIAAISSVAGFGAVTALSLSQSLGASWMADLVNHVFAGAGFVGIASVCYGLWQLFGRDGTVDAGRHE